MDSRDRMGELYESLDRRRRPEDIAELILGELDDLDPDDLRTVQEVAASSLRRGWTGYGYTSMADDFRRPVGMDRQLDVAETLFQVGDRPSGTDIAGVGEYLVRAEGTIAKAVGRSDFKADRLDRHSRKAAGLDLSRRQYNKRFRLAARMECKRERLAREMEKREFTLVSKSRLASKLSWEEFSKDRNTACFLAYYTARCNLRSEFTIDGQQRPFDETCDLLLRRCRSSATTNWWAISLAFPDREVLARLDDARKGELLGRWYAILDRIACLLKETWDRSAIERTTMIVRRGNDSSTWNVTAGAWNKARESWIALVHALGMEDVLDRMCVGKVLRLMAADVAAWHRMTGGGLDPETQVWNDLPLPWEVISGEADCPRALVESACRRHGVDPVKNGWAAPRPGRTVHAFRPTPELVHGVEVGDPGLALVLRKLGYFSGKVPPVSQGS
ncbi:MAG: hypothetical protein NVSMB9_30880 [Isosphaeraceae bacterium]